MPRDLRTRAIVLRRTNYGETDRILNFLTPEGKISAIAKSARKEKSRLAGGIELFSVSDIVIHQGRSDLGILTGAKMLKFFSHIMGNIAALELAGDLLKKLDRIAEQVESPELFDLLLESLGALDQISSKDQIASSGQIITLVGAWSTLNLARISGEQINLLTDINGNKLSPDLTYDWNSYEKALEPATTGQISATEIKLARLMLVSKLKTIASIENLHQILPKILPIAETFR